MQYTLTNGTLTDATQVMANFTHLLGCINALVLSGGSGVRQVATSGPVTTGGIPNFLPATSGTMLDIIQSNDPSIPNGFRYTSGNEHRT